MNNKNEIDNDNNTSEKNLEQEQYNRAIQRANIMNNPPSEEAPQKDDNEEDNKEETHVSSKVSKAINIISNKDSLKKNIIKKLLTSKFVIVMLIILMAFFLVFILLTSGSERDLLANNRTYVSSEYDYNKAEISIEANSVEEDESSASKKLGDTRLDDYVKGAVYYELNGAFDEDEDPYVIANAYAAAYIVVRSYLLSEYKYSQDNTKMTIVSGSDGVPYCNTLSGCSVWDNNSLNFTVFSRDSIVKILGNIINTIFPKSDDYQLIIKNAYDNTKYLSLVDMEVDEALTSYTFDIPKYNDETIATIISEAKEGSDFESILQDLELYEEYYLYDLTDYVETFEGAGDGVYWFPIGGPTSDEDDLYSGEPVCTSIGSKFGYSSSYFNYKVKHNGIDITCSLGTTVIAASDGLVVDLRTDCPTYGGTKEVNGKLVYTGGGTNCDSGNFVRISHLDGTTTQYYHFKQNSVTVKKGDNVLQGQKIGEIGSSGMSTGPHLHFGVIDSAGSYQDPLEYVSDVDARP